MGGRMFDAPGTLPVRCRNTSKQLDLRRLRVVLSRNLVVERGDSCYRSMCGSASTSLVIIGLSLNST